MDTWILRFREQPLTTGFSVPVVLFQVTADCDETELEVLKWASGGSSFGDLIHDEIEKGHFRLVLDLCGINRLDSIGFGEIVDAFVHARDAGGGLVLANLKSGIREILRTTGLDDKIPVFDSTAAAVRHFSF